MKKASRVAEKNTSGSSQSKILTLPWKTIEDVLTAYLYSIRAIPQSAEVSDIMIGKKNYRQGSPDVDLVVYYKKENT